MVVGYGLEIENWWQKVGREILEIENWWKTIGLEILPEKSKKSFRLEGKIFDRNPASNHPPVSQVA